MRIDVTEAERSVRRRAYLPLLLPGVPRLFSPSLAVRATARYVSTASPNAQAAADAVIAAVRAAAEALAIPAADIPAIR